MKHQDHLTVFDILLLMFVGFQWGGVIEVSWWWLALFVPLCLDSHHG